jgi:hypothetical protein
MSEGRVLTIDGLAQLRAKTEAVAKLLRERLSAQLETLRPVLAPRRLLGRHVRSGAREEVPGAERAFTRLRERYAQTCGRPFTLPKELDDEPLSIEPLVDLHPFEYPHTLEGDGRVIAITNPLRWVIGYRAGYSLSQLEGALANRASLRPSDAKQFLLNALALELLLETFPEISELFRELRYEVAIEKRAHLGELPLVTLRSALPAFRPADDLIAKATQFSGVPAFIELIDLDAVTRLVDPLRERIEEAAR